MHAVMTALPTPVELPEPGRLYQHHKGDFYRVITTANLSEDRDVTMVVYRSMKYGKRWIRPLVDPAGTPDEDLCAWTTMVRWPDGVMRPRYVQVAALPNGFVANDN